MTNQPPFQPGEYPPRQGMYKPPSQGGYQPQQGGYQPPQSNYPAGPQGGYPAAPQGGYPAPPPSHGGYAPPPPMAVNSDAYTPWITRVLAYFIDIIPVSIVMTIGYVIAFGSMLMSGAAMSTQCDEYGCEATAGAAGAPGILGILLFIVLWFASLGYAIWNWGYRQGKTGSTIGKGVMKFKVVSETTGQPIGFGMSIVRQLAHALDGFACYVGYLWPLWDDKRQTFADKIMKTICVPTNR